MTDHLPFSERRTAMAAYDRHVSPGKVALFEAMGVLAMMGRREGATFSDTYSDQTWHDCHCNGGVFNLGHRHPEIVTSMKWAVERLDIGNHHLISGYRARLAQWLAATTIGQLEGVVFGVSGGESIDLAIKTARGFTKRQGVVSAAGGYHGHTGLALAAGDPAYRQPFGENLPGFVQVPFNDLEAMRAAVGQETAAVILEPIPATLGMPIPAPGYFQGVRRICREQGALLIVDEIQTGLGRTGRIWGYQHEGINPDMLVTGKGLSGGMYPITATLMRREIHDFICRNPFVHISTFGGAEPGCVVALKVVNLVTADGFLERVNALSDRFAAGLEGLPFKLRRRGLMMGLKFAGEGEGISAAKQLYDAGVFCAYANNDTSVVQFLPPLVASDADADEIVRKVRKALT